MSLIHRNNDRDSNDWMIQPTFGRDFLAPLSLPNFKFPTPEWKDDGANKIFHVSIPNCSQHDLKVTKSEDDRHFTVSGTTTYSHEEKSEHGHSTSQRSSRFEQTHPIPAGVNLENITAKYADNWLEVVFPKQQQEQGQQQEA